MLDIIIGQKRNTIAANRLVELLRDADLKGTLYIGYPILASYDETILVDALLTCLEHGVVVFSFAESDNQLDTTDDTIRQQQDDIYTAVHQRLMNYRPLREGRSLRFEINVVTFVPTNILVRNEPDLKISGPDKLLSMIGTFDSIEYDLLREINAATQRVTNIKPLRRRSSVKKTNSRGAIMKEIEKEIANLDRWQNAGAIETPEGVQRIRGLAGSGKTVVLALKAAYLYAANPDWKIALTFHTRSLYQQFTDLVRRFTFEQLREEPDPDRLQIIHAWGSASQPGLYSEIAQAHGSWPKDFLYGKQTYGYEHAFDGVCKELLAEIAAKHPKRMYDAILIDEAQDFPHSFFELAYLVTRDPHVVIYAYDELQNLGDYTMAPPSELFGKDSSGMARVPDLENAPGRPKQDIVLPVCYRNTPWALSIAHAIGFGVNRKQGLVQFFDDPSLLTEIGYQIIGGQLAPGHQVALRRRSDTYPSYFEDLLEPSDAFECVTFPDQSAQAKALAIAVNKNLSDDELEPRDILVVIPDALAAKSQAGLVIKELAEQGIPAHLAGVTSSRDELFYDDSVAISSIYRAKGNEAAMVYVLNSEYGYAGFELGKRRNTLFTAITRSRAWVRLFGCGEAMDGLREEISQVIANDYLLRFRVPTDDELTRLRRLHRDMTPQERKKVEATLSEFEQLIQQGNVAPENLPAEFRRKLQAWLEWENGDDHGRSISETDQ